MSSGDQLRTNYSEEHDMFTHKRCYPSLTPHTPHTLTITVLSVKYNYYIYMYKNLTSTYICRHDTTNNYLNYYNF